MFNYKRIFHIPYRIFKARGSGFRGYKRDPRNFNIGIFGWFEYEPKHTRHVIKTLSVKDQGSLNTCVYNATAVQKEIDENEELSVRSIVIWAKRNGLLSGTGWSNGDAGQKVLKEFGIMKAKSLPENSNNWNFYSEGSLDFTEAEKHKIGSYWEVNREAEVFKLLDSDRVVEVAITWYTGFNQGGGFNSPWIIDKKVGVPVGGHEFVIKGYDLDYNGKRVYVCQNSYGKEWGDNGDFYIEIDYFHKNEIIILTNLDDINKDLGRFINDYDGKNVKTKDNPGIWHIQKGTKKLYPDWATYLAWDQINIGFEIVDGNVLNDVPIGDNMDIKKTHYWPMLENLKDPEVLNKVLELINQK